MMKRTIIYIAVCILTVGFSACGNSSAVIPKHKPGEPITPEVAQQLFVQRCATCHGSAGNLEIGGAKKLTSSALTKEEIEAQVRNGKGTMPPFRDMLTEEEIIAISQFTSSLQHPH